MTQTLEHKKWALQVIFDDFCLMRYDWFIWFMIMLHDMVQLKGFFFDLLNIPFNWSCRAVREDQLRFIHVLSGSYGRSFVWEKGFGMFSQMHKQSYTSIYTVNQHVGRCKMFTVSFYCIVFFLRSGISTHGCFELFRGRWLENHHRYPLLSMRSGKAFRQTFD